MGQIKDEFRIKWSTGGYYPKAYQVEKNARERADAIIDIVQHQYGIQTILTYTIEKRLYEVDRGSWE